MPLSPTIMYLFSLTSSLDTSRSHFKKACPSTADSSNWVSKFYLHIQLAGRFPVWGNLKFRGQGSGCVGSSGTDLRGKKTGLFWSLTFLSKSCVGACAMLQCRSTPPEAAAPGSKRRPPESVSYCQLCAAARDARLLAAARHRHTGGSGASAVQGLCCRVPCGVACVLPASGVLELRGGGRRDGETQDEPAHRAGHAVL